MYHLFNIYRNIPDDDYLRNGRNALYDTLNLFYEKSHAYFSQ